MSSNCYGMKILDQGNKDSMNMKIPKSMKNVRIKSI